MKREGWGYMACTWKDAIRTKQNETARMWRSDGADFTGQIEETMVDETEEQLQGPDIQWKEVGEIML